jgi:radical SAM superfamily enzyme YgiQ (UPF0313 family)
MLEPCDVLGVSATTANVNWGSEVARAWKGARVRVLGGRHVTDVLRGPHERFKQQKYFRGFDYLMVGECEKSFVLFCDWVAGRVPGGPFCVPGLVWFDAAGRLGRSWKESSLPDVTTLPGPAFDLWESGFAKGALSVTSFVGKEINADEKLSASICTSRGCPYGCAFCADARLKFRAETIEQIEREVAQLAGLGIRAVRIQDDTFTLSESRSRQIADVLWDHGMIWRAMTRCNLTNPEFFSYMARKGCTELGFGIEHGSAKILKAMNKGGTPESNALGVKICQDAGIVAHAFLIIGFPGETKETIGELRDWIARVKPEGCTLSLFQPYPGCDVWNHPEKYGITIPDEAFDRFWEVGRDDDPEAMVLDLPSITKRELFDARCGLAAWLDQNIGPLDRMTRKRL